MGGPNELFRDYFPSKFQPHVRMFCPFFFFFFNRYNQLQLRTTKCQWQEIKESQLVNMSKLYVYRQIIRKVENSTAYSITTVNEFIFSFFKMIFNLFHLSFQLGASHFFFLLLLLKVAYKEVVSKEGEKTSVCVYIAKYVCGCAVERSTSQRIPTSRPYPQ